MQKQNVGSADDDMKGVDEDVGVVEEADVLPFEHQEARQQRMLQQILML